MKRKASDDKCVCVSVCLRVCAHTHAALSLPDNIEGSSGGLGVLSDRNLPLSNEACRFYAKIPTGSNPHPDGTSSKELPAHVL
ncbi:hypothetical protein chiPu_0015013 [Chiloscyllium punctatum]|uniref:Uncharacterized protein n=1 Tax=Chiloscyllium punctatum TaxID=137246 RepID=A0A401T1J5_CHIPU|nr:hypothetical protein [Chiloscyllium punctatum]